MTLPEPRGDPHFDAYVEKVRAAYAVYLIEWQAATKLYLADIGGTLNAKYSEAYATAVREADEEVEKRIGPTCDPITRRHILKRTIKRNYNKVWKRSNGGVAASTRTDLSLAKARAMQRFRRAREKAKQEYFLAVPPELRLSLRPPRRVKPAEPEPAPWPSVEHATVVDWPDAPVQPPPPDSESAGNPAGQ